MAIVHDDEPSRQMESPGSHDLAVPQQRDDAHHLTTTNVLRAVLDHIDDVRGTAKAALSTANGAHSLAEQASARLDAIEGRHGWYAALAYCKLRDLPTSLVFTQHLGKVAAKIAAREHISPYKVEHHLYGKVNAFPEAVWDEAAEELRHRVP